MFLAPKQVFARFAARISGTKLSRRRRLNAGLATAADCVLEPRLMMSASSGDDTSGGDPGTGGVDPGTGGGGGGTIPGDSGMDNMPPMLSVTVAPVPDTAVNGDVVGYATATDVDVGDTITFSFEGGSATDPTGTFAIDASTGVITVANADNIGSQDESEDSPEGWSFAATVIASDGVIRPVEIGFGIQFSVMKSVFQINSPANGDVIKSTDELVVKTTRAKGVKVRAEILMEVNGAYVDPRTIIPGLIVERVAAGTAGKAKATFEFGTGPVGRFRVDYSFKLSNGTWQYADSVFFTVEAP